MVDSKVAWIVNALGIIIIVLGLEDIKSKLGFLPNISGNYLIIIGVIIVAVGIFLLKISDSGKTLEEVPIYEGRGKKRKVIAYQRMKKKK